MRAAEIVHGMTIKWGGTGWTVIATRHSAAGVEFEARRCNVTGGPTEGTIGPVSADHDILVLRETIVVWPVELRRRNLQVERVIAWAATGQDAADIVNLYDRVDVAVGLSVAIARPPA